MLAPPAELLSLIEGFLEVKGDVASRLYRLIDNNSELIRSAYGVIVNNAGTVHSITLTGVQLLRGVLEFVIQCLNQWEVSAPVVSYEENQPTSESFDFK